MTVGTLQVDRDVVRLLAASQTYFDIAGRWRLGQLMFVVALPTGLAVYGAFQPRQDFFIPFIGFFAALLDATLFNFTISSSRYRAAQLRDIYDARLVARPLSAVRASGGPSAEAIREAAEAYLRRPGAKTLAESWYYRRVAELSFPVADMLYIRTNTVQDEQLRERYVWILTGTALASIVALVLLGGVLGWDIKLFVANVLFPLVPAAAWLGREIVDQFEALTRKTRIRCLLDDVLITAQIRQDAAQDLLGREREALHGLQFMFRSRHPSVPWWLYVWHRKRQRETLEATLDDFINDAIAAGHGAGAGGGETMYTQQ